MSRLRQRFAVLAVAAGLAGAAWTVGAAVDAQPARAASLAGGILGQVTGGLSSLNPVTAGTGALAGIALTAVGAWVLGGAKGALEETASVVGETTTPRVESAWFSSTYWRVAGLGAMLTLPFLFAAAAQALVRSDLALLGRAAFGYLPLALLGVSIAAPLTMLLLSATDEMCAVVGSVGASGGAAFLRQTARVVAGLGTFGGAPFLAFVVGLFTLAVAIGLALEMLVREAAVYIVMLMLPLAFAALVWPARRVWAIRLVELLVALILSKFVIVAVLSLAGAAAGGAGTPAPIRVLTAMALLLLSAFAPWVMLRLLPFTELAAGAAGALRSEVPRLRSVPMAAASAAEAPAAFVESLRQRMQRHAQDEAAEETEPESRFGPGASIGGEGDTDSEAPGALAVAELPAGNARGDDPPRPDRQGAGAGERSPGMEPIWQMENGTWPPLLPAPGRWGGPTEYRPPDQGAYGPPDHGSAAPDQVSAPPDEPAVPPIQEDPEGRL